jgi:hypothetical protein
VPASPVLSASAAAALAVVAALAPGAARGADAPQGDPSLARQGFSLAARAGWAAPFGDLSGAPGASLEQTVRSKIPLWVDVGYRVHPRFLVNLFLEYADVQLEQDACGSACDGRSVRFGVDVQLLLAPGRRLVPWVGLGVAVEFLELETTLDLDGDGVAETVGERDFAGLELPLVEAGFDVVVSSRFRLGPYLALSPAVFTSEELQAPGASGSPRRIDDLAVHAWLQVGLKVAFDL